MRDTTTQIRTLFDLVAARAATDPDAVMLAVEGRGDLSYQEWHVRARHLSSRLWHAGARPGMVVGLDFATAEWLEYAVAYVAVLRLGCCVETVRDGDPRSDVLELFGEACRRVVLSGSAPVSLDSLRYHALMAEPQGDLVPDVSPMPDESAEILRSSGTTGVPKQIVRRVGDLLPTEHATFTAADEPEELVLYTPFGTNASQKQILSVLRTGTTRLVMLQSFSPRYLRDTVRRRRARGVSLVPSAAELVLRSGGDVAGDLASVCTVVLSSDFATPDLQRRLLEVMPSASITKRYGLTEAGVASVVGEYDPARPLRIGRPVEGTEIRIVDAARQPVAPGVDGLVAIRHVTGALDESGGWTYTQDCGRLLEDGSLEVFGRDTDFLHIGTTRASMRYVEAELRHLDGVGDVAVTRVGDRDDNGRIGVLVVPEGARADVLAAVGQWLQDSYHLTGSRMVLRQTDEIPRTSTGKIATTRMTDLLFAGPAVEVDDIGRLVLDTARDLVGIDDIGPDDSLAERGLDSLQAVALMSALADALGMVGELDMAAPFFHSSVRDLAGYLGQALDERGRQ